MFNLNHKVESFYHKFTYTWTHLVICKNTNDAVLIDPVLDYDPNNGHTSTTFIDGVLDYMTQRNIQLRYVVETHAHADHLTSSAYVNDNTGARLAIGEKISCVQETFKRIFNLGHAFKTDGSQFDLLLKANDVLSFGECHLKILHTPGHTDDSISYCIGESVFVGDTLFSPDYGSARCDFPEGSAEKLYDSVQEIYKLGSDKKLYLCHDYPPKLRQAKAMFMSHEQQQKNIHLNTNMVKKDFVKLRNFRDKKLNQPRLIIPAIQVNIAAGDFPQPENNGCVYLKTPLNVMP